MPRLATISLIAFSISLLRLAQPAPVHAAERPNVVVIFADDLGYGDLSCYGNPTIRTPHLDRMAAEGLRFTQFYSAASVCTPSRAGLLTGRLPVRTGMCSDKRRVLFPDSGGGMPDSELTLAEALKAEGYATGCFGKWHLGHLPQFLPTAHGFDTYYGIPYSNDMDRLNDVGPKGRDAFNEPKSEYWNVPLLQDTEVVERPTDQTTITRRYTEKAIDFIKQHKAGPFFVYLPHSMPHVPLFRSPEFEGRSDRGMYGDVVEEVDWSVGQVLQTLRDEGLAENTIVWFTSDNGPWLIFGDHGGTAGLLKDGKGCTWDGGMREPGIVWWPGHIPAGTVEHGLAATLDILPTCVALAGGELPSDRPYDGHDLTPLLLGTAPSPRETVYYYRGTRLMAVRHGPWKAHFITQGAYGQDSATPVAHDPPLLIQIEHDPSERHDRRAGNQDVLAKIATIVAEHQRDLEIPPSQLDIPLP
ncbi:MAG: sulfatase [Planctomycetaceae bacterium]